MPSSLNWLDTSAEHQRKIRELIRLFEEPGTRDELGIGPIRDSFSEQLFPGTSVTQTRARYLLFVPWHFVEQTRLVRGGQEALRKAEASERRMIEKFREAALVDGLIGRQAGAALKLLPSAIYWNGLERFGILRAPMTRLAAASYRTATGLETDEFAYRGAGAWHPTLPAVPMGFPGEETGGFDLTDDEALWLRERILGAVPGTLLAHFVDGAPLLQADAPWFEPSLSDAPPNVVNTVEQASRFSRVIQGAALLYNLLVSEAYEEKGFNAVGPRIEFYREELQIWAAGLDGEFGRMSADIDGFWSAVATGNPRVAGPTREFLGLWLALAGDTPERIADSQEARSFLATRAKRLRGPRSLLVNEKLLALWQGSSGSEPLVYRWRTVRRIITDIHEGLARVHS